MLIRRPRRRRAAAVRRRPWFLLALLAAVCGLAVARPWPGPGFRTAGARAASHRARLSLLAAGASGEARRLDSLIAAAEAVTARELAAPSWRRDEAALYAAWERALTVAGESLADVSHRRMAARGRWQELEAEVASAVAVARTQSRAAGLGRQEARWLARAEVALAQARRLAAAGSHEAAVAQAERALAHAGEIDGSWSELHSRFVDGELRSKWRALVRETVTDSAWGGRNAVVVDKLKRRLDVYASGRQVASFEVELGSQGLRRKLHAGDRATPEGRYRVVDIKTGPRTRFYEALLLDYPNQEDRDRYAIGRARGEIPAGAGIGGLIEIHGHGGQGRDWTDGCIALTNADMDRLLRFAGPGTVVMIVGTVPDDDR